MSTNELTEAYSNGQLSRRRFIRGLIAAGVTAAAATAYADLLAPRGAGAAMRAQVSVYETTTTSSSTTSSTAPASTTSSTAATTSTSTASTSSTSTSSTTSTTAASAQGTGTVSSSVVAPDGTVTFAGGGFGSQQPLALEIQSAPQSLGTTTSDASGNFSVTVRIPANTTEGTHRLVARGPAPNGATREVVATITVTAALSRTGSDAVRLTLLGVATAALGKAVLGIRRLLGDEPPRD